MAKRKYVVGNWKMNGLHGDLAEAAAIASAAARTPVVDVGLCPPATLIAPMVAACPGLSVGGQDCHTEAKGAFTGSIAAGMLVDAGAAMVIVGHSERREGLGETSAMVRAKAIAGLAAGLSVILCVGEPVEVRRTGGAIGYVLAQIDESVPADFSADRLAIAYEPIWAIGTGLVPTEDDVAAMHAAISWRLSETYGAQAAAVRILYGGSVTGDNAATLLAVANVDGALVGGASLTAAKFVPIIEAAAGIG